MVKVYTVLGSLIAAFLLAVPANAQAEGETSNNEKAETKADKPLNITIRPLRKTEKELKELKQLSIDDVGESVVILRNGATLSLKDWVLGGLNRNDISGAMSDLQQRQFLGQVAADLMLHEDATNIGQPLPVGPLMPGLVQSFVPVKLSPEAALLQSLVCKFACFEGEGPINGLGATAAASTIRAGNFVTGQGDAFIGGNGDAFAFRRNLARALSISYGDWKRNQFLLDMAEKAADPSSDE